MQGFVEKYFALLQTAIGDVDTQAVSEGVKEIRSAWLRGSQIITLGNGGSAMTALHFVTDWSKAVYLKHGKPFRGRSLVDNMGLLTAYSNDISYADVFSEQLKNIMQPDDLVVAVSGSGNSENIIRAVDYANEHGGRTLGLSGFSGGRLKEKAQTSIWVNLHDMQLVEDIHSIFGHIVMRALCDAEASDL